MRETTITSSTAQSSSDSVKPTNNGEAKPRQCRDCGAVFPSGAALFKHLRFDNCRNDAQPEAIPVRHSVALFFGYTCIPPETAGKLLLRAFLHSDNKDNGREFIGSTQSSIANNRHAFLQQDADCPSGMDTLVVNYWSAAAADNDDANAANSNLEATLQKLLDNHNQSKRLASLIKLHGMRILDTQLFTLHAEQSCTQHIYHFMVPATWLPDSAAILKWYHQSVVTGELRRQQQQGDGTKQIMTPPSLKKFKDILRSVESQRQRKLVAEGRFRTLAYNVKRPWHNFCDPTLRASPNHDVTLRIVDRARFLRFIVSAQDQLFVVYEFRGDQFLSQQVRRIVGAAVAMVHGWLPEDFIETSLVASSLQETPLAPTGYLYQAAPRFHYAELCHKGVELFRITVDDKKDKNKSWSTTRFTKEDPIKWIQQQLLADMANASSLSSNNNHSEWLVELRDTVAPRICTDMLKRQEERACSSDDSTEFARTTAPQEYVHVLKLLQDIVANGKWPATSAARSRVMETLEDPSTAGSFTVVDELTFDVSHPPRANALFPELVTAVFQLQASIDKSDQTSSHCAVNCNAQFTPHVDSGRGAGQSLSTIVGLGDYRAGEIMVEGDAHNIRYKPLQFDGWKLRHWTRPFSGERFSLVWFTPEGVERKRVSF